MGETVEDVEGLPDDREIAAGLQAAHEFRGDAGDDGVVWPRGEIVDLVGRRRDPHIVREVESQEPSPPRLDHMVKFRAADE